MTDFRDSDPQITTIADAVIKLKEIRESHKNLNEPDIEEQFARLSLAFKTDRFTLQQRLDLQQRQRDIAEKNIDSELKCLRESLNALNQLCTDSDMREVITKTQQHVDIVQQTTVRMSSRAETFGAMQQEQRMNSAFETMLSYVEHLKLLYDKEHLELEEYRRLLAEHNLLPDEKNSGDGSDDKKSLPPRSQSLSSSSKPEPRSRLLSAVCLLTPNTESGSLSNPSLSPKSRRASMPVGPVSTVPKNNLLDAGDPAKNLSLTDRKDAQHRCCDSPGFESSPVLVEADCSGCDNSTAIPRVLPYHSSISSSRLSFGSSLNESDEILVPGLSEDEDVFHNPDPKPSSCLFRLLRWSASKQFSNGSALMLQLRYFLSATLAIAALLSFVFTFLPDCARLHFNGSSNWT